mmetsp:Transcript_13967/g.22119  ORF Transcript_13967/g.22119 Transcript_13967/m.22119 type:complete len:205 (+) Transcript_13967:861-1475(+)
MRFVPNQFKVRVLETVNVRVFRVYLYRWKWCRFAFQLFFQRFNMVFIDMTVTNYMYEFTSFESGTLCDKVCQKRVRSDVKRHTKAHISRSLVHLARQFSVRDVKLSKHMTGGKGHQVECSWVPSGQNHSTVIWVRFNCVNQLRQLIHAFPCIIVVHGCVVGTKMPPLKAVHWSEIAFLSLCQAQFIQKFTGAIPVPNVNVFLLK